MADRPVAHTRYGAISDAPRSGTKLAARTFPPKRDAEGDMPMQAAHVQDDRSGLVTALFRDRERAERAYRYVRERGYVESDINIMMTDETRRRHFAPSRTRETELAAKVADDAAKP